jgi:nucleotide-binding universal stress UspA family protein
MKTRLRDFLQLHPDTEKMAHFLVEAGPAAQVIVKVAEHNQMDMIIMGLRAWSTDGPPMWRTAYQVVTHASCPVLSMKTEVDFDSST